MPAEREMLALDGWHCDCVGPRCDRILDSRYLDLHVTRCPQPLYRVGPYAELLRLDAASRVSPIAGWPGHWSAWVVRGMVALAEWRAVRAARGA